MLIQLNQALDDAGYLLFVTDSISWTHAMAMHVLVQRNLLVQRTPSVKACFKDGETQHSYKHTTA